MTGSELELEREQTRAWKAETYQAMRGFNLVKTQNAILRSSLTAHQKWSLVAIIDHWSRKKPIPWPGIETIAALAGISRRSVMRALGTLETAGAVRIWKRRNRPNLYDLSAVREWCEAHPRTVSHTVSGFASGFASPEGPQPDVTIQDGEPNEADSVGHTPSREDDASLTPGVVPGSHPPGATGAPTGCLGDTRRDRQVLKSQGREPTISPGGESSSPSLSSSSASRDPKKRLPRDNATLELERFYCDQYRSSRGTHYYPKGKPDAKSRAALKSLHEDLGLEEAKRIIAVTFQNAWASQNRCLPWEIFADRMKLTRGMEVGIDRAELAGIVDASALGFKLRLPTDQELRLQESTGGEDLALIEQARAGTTRLNPAWLFEHGFNPENTGWLQEKYAMDQWAAVKYAHNDITPRWKMMVGSLDRKAICQMLFAAMIRPSHPHWKDLSIWRSKEGRADALKWEREYVDTVEKKSA
jgi:hypothetical protein